MTPSEYLKASARTEDTPCFIAPTMRDSEKRISQLLHAAMGMTTESSEFIDALKKLTIYGKNLDTVNLVEELGDVMWYLALACRALDVSLEEVMTKNIAKLMKRFPEKFTSERALVRDLDGERAALEGRDP